MILTCSLLFIGLLNGFLVGCHSFAVFHRITRSKPIMPKPCVLFQILLRCCVDFTPCGRIIILSKLYTN